MALTEILSAVLIFAAGFFCFRLKELFEHGKDPAGFPAEEKPKSLPLSVCRKGRPSIEEQIINLALYNGEDQIGGDGE